MLLYDVFYPGRGLDRSVPLPKKPAPGSAARCVNGHALYLVANRGGWVTKTESEFRRRLDMMIGRRR